MSIVCILLAQTAFIFHSKAIAKVAVESAKEASDPFLWLEDVNGKNAIEWVKKVNAESKPSIESSPEFGPLKKRLFEILSSKTRIPYVHKIGKYYYNFWRDDKAVRGTWRRTSLEEYKKNEPAWEIVLDLDKLAKDENKNWVWEGCNVLQPSFDRGLISLSVGGSDATVLREFDLNKKEFVKDGFNIPEAKTYASWRNHDSLYVGTNFGKGSLTNSGYPRLVKEWKRGTALSQAKTIFEGKASDVSVSANVTHDHGVVYEFINRTLTTYTSETRIKRGNEWILVNRPADANFGSYIDNAFLDLRTDWTVNGKTYKAGSALIENMQDYLKGERNFDVIFEPKDGVSLSSISFTKNYILLTQLENVRTHAFMLKHEGGKWLRTAVKSPEFSDVSLWGIDSDESDDYFMTLNDFLTPTTLYLGTAGIDKVEKIKSSPSFFKADGLEIQQFQATSKDGTKIPYFMVGKKDLKLDGQNPTLLYGYGGFEYPLLSGYDAMIGAAWLERGGVYICANIRGGNEFGPKWHTAAIKEHKQRSYDDFIAVAEDLIARKVTSPKHLGIDGASNGGLLMGVMLTQKPELFGAIHCGSPLLDMKRYSQLLAGASWMEEYGDPQKESDWAYISKYSPYQNLQKEKKYPPILITSSTKDDRVHPGHARKTVAKLKEQGHEVYYYENIEGGHGAAANQEQSAYMEAIAYDFLWNRLK